MVAAEKAKIKCITASIQISASFWLEVRQAMIVGSVQLARQ